jgi:mannose-6-phosphate isomerase-like protein (cupin superfamily)
MIGIEQLSIVSPGVGRSRSVESGSERIICDADLCSSSNLTVYRRVILPGRQLDLQATGDYHLVYIVQNAGIGTVRFKDEIHAAEQGAGVLLAPAETANFDAGADPLELLHLVAPKPPAAVEHGLPGGPGYFFNRRTLRALTDASGGRIRRFCAESSIRRRDGQRLTLTNAIQAGEMHYNDGGSSPYHVHVGTSANPNGAAHCYITFQGHGLIEVDGQSRAITPGTLVYIPAGVPHRLRAQNGPLDYFEVQAWRSFKTTILSEEPLGLKWFYERESPGEALTEWTQS